MRAQRPISREEEEVESVFVPMTDLVVSFLFIMMLLLAFFAVKYDTQDTVPRADLVAEQEKVKAAEKKIEDLNLRIADLLKQIDDLKLRIEELLAQIDDKDKEIADLNEQIAERDKRIKELEEELAQLKKNRVNPLELYVQSSRLEREKILRQIEAQLRKEFDAVFTEQNIIVEVNGDALRFKGRDLFATGRDDLTGERLQIVKRLGDITLNAIQCYTINSLQTEYSACNPNGVVVEVVQIEGHTDAVGTNESNLPLSTRRANRAFFAMQEERSDILDFRNLSGQPVASVAGYGEMRPVAPDTPANRSENRRIDLRIIMYTPGSVSEVLQLQERIRNNLLSETEAEQ
jgi:flagellar motor protein MotB